MLWDEDDTKVLNKLGVVARLTDEGISYAMETATLLLISQASLFIKEEGDASVNRKALKHELERVVKFAGITVSSAAGVHELLVPFLAELGAAGRE